MRVRPSNPKEQPFEDAPISVNASDGGLYFTTQRSGYRAGMELLLSFPFHAAGDPMNCDYVARVARVEKLRNGRFGIGVELLINLTAGRVAGARVAET